MCLFLTLSQRPCEYLFSLYHCKDLGEITYFPAFIELLNRVNLCLSASSAMLFERSTICFLMELFDRNIFSACLPLFWPKRDLNIAVGQSFFFFFYHIFFYPVSFTFQDNSETVHKESYKQISAFSCLV